MIIDLFAGARGWGEGATMLGLVSVGIETDHPANLTAGQAGHLSIEASVVDYPPERFAGRVEGLTASPPCQGFSQAGKRLMLDDPRSVLVWEPVRWVTATSPLWACFEQVPEVAPIWRVEAEKLRSVGYSTWTGVVDAADYGVPQNRLRAVLVASRVRRVSCPPPTHCEGGGTGDGLFGVDDRLPWVSMADALGWPESFQLDYLRGSGMTARYGERAARPASRPAPTITGAGAGAGAGCGAKFVLHTNRGQNPDGSRQTRDCDSPALSVTAKSGSQWKLQPGSWADGRGGHRECRDLTEPAPTIALGHDVNGWAWTRPATTVQTTDRVAQPGHHDHQWDHAIKVAIPELGVLQSFPADYPWTGNKSQQARQVGNAIPPLLARALIAEAAGIVA
jgi:DNA (cytosine-5)-methyltransferase 1